MPDDILKEILEKTTDEDIREIIKSLQDLEHPPEELKNRLIEAEILKFDKENENQETE